VDISRLLSSLTLSLVTRREALNPGFAQPLRF
jgi:hypothetical protein